MDEDINEEDIVVKAKITDIEAGTFYIVNSIDECHNEEDKTAYMDLLKSLGRGESYFVKTGTVIIEMLWR